jgi:hypothetical protein
VFRPLLFIAAALALPVLAAPAAPETAVHRDTREELQDVNLYQAVTEAQAQTGGPDGLAPAWCGDERTSDDTAHAASPLQAPQIKVVYAYAADRPNRFAEWRDALQADVAITERFLSAQSGGLKALRFDMGTNCGPQYADIQVVALPGPYSTYAGDFRAITQAVESVIGGNGHPRNPIILADGLSASAVEYGLGETVMGASGERPGPSNTHNAGGLSAVLFSRDGAPAPGANRRGWWPEGFLHEITHTLGAVQWGAPHSTQPAGQSQAQYGHCWQGADVMCYTEDAGAAHAMQMDCAAIEGAITQSYDCGRDDYFNPAPAPGSYLATHWNTYDSVFLATCQEIAPACGGSDEFAPEPPAATAGPAIAGASRRGKQLKSSSGTWINAPQSYSYQWQRLTTRGWRDIAGADEERYTTQGPDLGRRLRVMVLATNADGTTAAASAPTAPVGAVAVNKTASAKGKVRKKKHRR